MTLPNLLIVGAAKSGTTSLHNYLNQHPDIFMCKPKEPHFLISKEIGINRIPNAINKKRQYIDLFKSAKNKKYVGESSVLYLAYPNISIKNIKKHLNDQVKIIIMLRNPVQRAYSGYQHVKRYNSVENLSFDQALKKSEFRYSNNSAITPASRYLELGNYYKQVKLFKQKFEFVHVIIYDDYLNHFNIEMEKVFDFLNLNKVHINTQTKHMVGGWEWNNLLFKKLLLKNSILKKIFKNLIPKKRYRKYLRDFILNMTTRSIQEMDPQTENWLKNYYKDDIIKLSKLINRNLNHWIS